MRRRNLMFRANSLILQMLFVAFSAITVDAEETRLPWPDRGGPTMNGRVAKADAKNLPLKWNEESNLNIAWKVES